MLSAVNLANNIIKRSFTENVDVTPMKLQKLLYFIYKKYLQDTKKQLFAERFLAWKHGPVIQSVYQQFKAFETKKITKFARDTAGDVYLADENTNLDLTFVINYVWNKYRGLDGLQLSKLTHKHDSAWDRAVKNGTYVLKDEDIEEEPELY